VDIHEGSIWFRGVKVGGSAGGKGRGLWDHSKQVGPEDWSGHSGPE
jgi:hypothetical protein